MDEKKEELEIKKDTPNVDTNEKKVVARPKVEVIETQKSLEEHMKENKKNTKYSIDWWNLLTYVVMIAIIIGVALLLIRFCEKYENGDFNKTTTTTKNIFFTTTTTTKPEPIYQTTTRAQTKATHTVFPGNR